MHRRSAFILLLASGLSVLAQAANDAGWLGFSVTVETEGFISFNPTLRSVRIGKVVPGSPAAQAGLMTDDLVIDVRGVVVARAKADAVKAAVRTPVGQTLALTVQRGSAAPMVLTLTAIEKPAGQ